MNSGISLKELKLNTAIKDYNDKKYKQHLKAFMILLPHPVEWYRTRYRTSYWYLHGYKKYEDAWNIYSELAKADNIKLDTLKQMANYYNNGYINKDERLIFEIALKLYKYSSGFSVHNGFILELVFKV
ncbi:19467_t:CDS:2 [Gigaspora margarita]|uniref:19467_t:CDS:1 n=1 Tax=Gigaspora margarita TaxID=4874 RepID=A0ABN7V5H1_GIGMA|nr:19467_t:CDS:2 [Gigaspora margarita]